MKNKFVAFLMSFLMVFSVVGATPITTSVYAEENPTPTQETTQVSEQEELVDSDVVYQEDLDAYGLVYDEGNSANLNCIIYTDGNDWFRFAHSGNAPDAWYIYNDGSWFYTADSVVNNATVEMSAEPSPEISASTNKESKEDGVVTTIYGEDLVKLDNGEFVLEADDFSDAVKATPRFFSLFSLDEPAQATLTDFKYIGAYTGTAPFDTTLTSDQAGFDRTQEDKIVRSYDKVIYRTSYSIGVDAEGKTVTSGTLHFEAYLNVQPDVATWDLNAMNWLNNASITEENGSQKLSGDITFNGGQMAPRIGVINWAIAVGGVNPDTKGGAINGTKIPAPEFSVWVNDDAPEDVLSTDIVTVSSKTTLDAEIQYAGKNDAGQPLWGVNLMLVANAKDNGIKGIEVPVLGRPTTIDLHLDSNMEFLDIKNNSTEVTGSNGLTKENIFSSIPGDDGSLTDTVSTTQVRNGGTVTSTPLGSNSDIQLTITGLKTYDISETKVNRSLSGGIYYDDTVYPLGEYVLLTTVPTGYVVGNTEVIINNTITDLTAVDNFGDQVKDSNADNNIGQYTIAGKSETPVGTYMYGPKNMSFTATWRNGALADYSVVDGKNTVEIYPGDIVSFTDVVYRELGVTYATYGGIKQEDVFIKIDGEQFEPLVGTETIEAGRYPNETFKVVANMTAEGNFEVATPENDLTNHAEMYYVAKKDGTNWTSDAEQVSAVFGDGSNYLLYKTAQEIIDSGNICVGVKFVFNDSYAYTHPATAYGETGLSGVGAPVVSYMTPKFRAKGDLNLNSSGTGFKDQGDETLVSMMLPTSTFTMVNGQVFGDYNTSTASSFPTGVGAGSPADYYSHYKKAVYDSNGMQITPSSSLATWYGPTEHYENWVSLSPLDGGVGYYLRRYTTYLDLTIDQITSIGGVDATKEVFNLDSDQRIVNFTAVSGTEVPVHIDYNNAVQKLVFTLPDHVSPVNPTATNPLEMFGVSFGGTAVQDDTINGGAGVSYTGSVTDITESETWKSVMQESGVTDATMVSSVSPDGKTLTLTFTNYPVSYEFPDVHFAGLIGTPEDITTDVITGTNLIVGAELQDSYAVTTSKKVGFTPIRMGGSIIKKNSINPIRDANLTDIGFDVIFNDEGILSATQDGSSRIAVIDILPYEGDDNGNGDMGDYTLKNPSVVATLEKLSGHAGTSELVFYYTTQNPTTVKTDVGDFLMGTDLYDFGDSYWQSETDMTKIPALLTGQKITAIGWSLTDCGAGTNVKFHYEYNWDDAEEKTLHESTDIVTNTAIVAGENGVLQKTTATDSTKPTVYKFITGINDTVKDDNSLNGESIQIGDVLTYTVYYFNPLDDSAKVTITDPIPTGTEYVDGSASDGGSLSDGKVVWNLENIPAGENGSVSFKVTVTEDAIKTVDNKASMILNDDPDLKYDTNTTKNPIIKLSAIKSSNPVNGTLVERGDTITYKVTLTNDGDNTIPFATLRDMIPDGTTYVDGSVTGASGGSYIDKYETFGFTGQTQTFVAPTDGTYTFEVYGASGGNGTTSGLGGDLVTKQVTLKAGDVVTINVGGSGNSAKYEQGVDYVIAGASTATYLLDNHNPGEADNPVPDGYLVKTVTATSSQKAVPVYVEFDGLTGQSISDNFWTHTYDDYTNLSGKKAHIYTTVADGNYKNARFVLSDYLFPTTGTGIGGTNPVATLKGSDDSYGGAGGAGTSIEVNGVIVTAKGGDGGAVGGHAGNGGGTSKGGTVSAEANAGDGKVVVRYKGFSESNVSSGVGFDLELDNNVVTIKNVSATVNPDLKGIYLSFPEGTSIKAETVPTSWVKVAESTTSVTYETPTDNDATSIKNYLESLQFNVPDGTTGKIGLHFFYEEILVPNKEWKYNTIMNYVTGSNYNGGVTSGVQTFTAPVNGTYKLEANGATVNWSGSGYTSHGDYNGGYASGTVRLKKGDVVYVIVGGHGSANTGGAEKASYNGGGYTTSDGGRGAGATHFALSLQGDGELKNYATTKDDVLLVAGGAGANGHGGSADAGGNGFAQGVSNRDNAGGGGWEGGSAGKGGTNYINTNYVTEIASQGGDQVTSYDYGAKITILDYVPDTNKKDYLSAYATIPAQGSCAYNPNGDYVECVVTSLTAGGTYDMTFQVTVDEDCTLDQVENVALYEPSTKFPGKPGEIEKEPSNETNHIIHPIANPILEVTKSSNPENGTLVNRGDEIEYSVTVKNTGNGVAKFVPIRDYIPAGTTYVVNSVSTGGTYVEKLTPTTDEKSGNYVEWVLTNLKPDDEATVTFKVTVNESCGLDQLENVALYEETPKNPGEPGKIEKDPAHETNKIIHPLGTPILEVIKGSNPVTGTIVNNGDEIEYSVTVKNTGNGVAKFVPIRDYIPAGTTYVANSVSTGGAYVEKLTPTTDEKSGNYVEWVLTNLKPNEEATVTFKVTVNESCNLDQVENVALYEETPKNPGEPGEIEKDPAHETNKIIHPLGEPLIETVKSSNPENGTTVQKGDTITYTVSVTNSGTGIAKFVQVRDYIPDGTTYVANSIVSPTKATGAFVQANTTGTNKAYVEWVLTDVEPGESRDVTFKVTVNTDITLDKVTNVALYETFPKNPGEPGKIEKDPTHETNKIVHPLGQPSVTVTKSSDPVTGTVVKKGQTITYYLDVKNNGTAPVAFTQVRDYIPLMTTYVQNSVSSVSGAGGAYVQNSNDGAYVEWVLDNLGVGETRRVSFKVTVNQNAVNKILNEALYDWMEEDPGKPGEITNKPSIKTNQTVHPLVIVTQTGDERTILPYVGLGIAGLLLLLIALVLQKKKAIKKSTKN